MIFQAEWRCWWLYFLCWLIFSILSRQTLRKRKVEEQTQTRTDWFKKSIIIKEIVCLFSHHNFTLNNIFFKSTFLVRPDCSGDLGGVLHHPRVRGPGGVRAHPQDDPGPQEAGVETQAPRAASQRGQGGPGQPLLLPGSLQTGQAGYLGVAWHYHIRWIRLWQLQSLLMRLIRQWFS